MNKIYKLPRAQGHEDTFGEEQQKFTVASRENRLEKLRKAAEDQKPQIILNSFDNQQETFTKITYFAHDKNRDIADIFSPLSTRQVQEGSPYSGLVQSQFQNKMKFPMNKQQVVKQFNSNQLQVKDFWNQKTNVSNQSYANLMPDYQFSDIINQNPKQQIIINNKHSQIEQANTPTIKASYIQGNFSKMRRPDEKGKQRKLLKVLRGSTEVYRQQDINFQNMNNQSLTIKKVQNTDQSGQGIPRLENHAIKVQNQSHGPKTSHNQAISPPKFSQKETMFMSYVNSPERIGKNQSQLHTNQVQILNLNTKIKVTASAIEKQLKDKNNIHFPQLKKKDGTQSTKTSPRQLNKADKLIYKQPNNFHQASKFNKIGL